MTTSPVNPESAGAEMPQAHLLGDGELVLTGNWRCEMQRPAVDDVISDAQGRHLAAVRVRADDITAWDSTLLLYIAALEEGLAAKGMTLECGMLPGGMVKLLEMRRNSAGSSENAAPAKERQTLVELLGIFGIRIVTRFMSIVDFVGTLTVDLLSLLVGRSRMRAADLRDQMVVCGPKALGIISLISFLMGLILAFIGAIPLRWFQAESYVSSLVGIGMLRLMAPVMVGIVMAGRTSASYAAELGSMQVNEEIDVMETMGISSMQFLVLPRFIAMSLMLPLLCVFADIVSVLGGMCVSMGYLQITALSYFDTLFTTTRINDFLVGVFTAFVLGILDGICGCYQGMKCGRSAAAVGNATTGAVVSSIICIVIATSLITVITVVLGI